ncbi:MAG TPA: branched-chain amino acid ABC transporter permease [Thermoprotei archaeon]|nr:branched-chain amino acid ABC transporter permease [Thermoprotei archaeon]
MGRRVSIGGVEYLLSTLPLFILNGLFYAATLFLIASGLTIIFSVAGILNLAHGAIFMLGAYLATLTMLTGDIRLIIITFIIVPFIIGLIGLGIERGLIKWVYDRESEYQLLLTYGLSLVLADLVRMMFGPQPISASFLLRESGVIDILGVTYPVYNLIVIVVALFVGLLLWLFLDRTRLGWIVRACSFDREMSSALGVNVGLIYAFTFFLGSALGGLAGALIVPSTVAMLGMDVNALIESFIVIVIGGLGSIRGAFIGSIIVGLVRSFGIYFFPRYELAFIYIIMAVVLLIRPRGLFGREYRRV